MLEPRFFDVNHANPVDFAKVATWAWGAAFKANQGLGFTDPLFKTRRAAAVSFGLMVAGYDFATNDPVSENVDRFLSIVQPDAKTACILDFEDLKTGAMTGDEAYEWLDRVGQKTGRAPHLYGGNRIVSHIDHQAAKWIDMAAIIKLYLCQYKAIQVDTLEQLKPHIIVPKPWTTWTFLQYAADGDGPQPHTMPGVENKADLNVFDGTREEFNAVWPGASVVEA